MKKKLGIPFLLAILLLIISEYLFLQELYGSSRWMILFLTSIGIIGGILILISVIRKYNS